MLGILLNFLTKLRTFYHNRPSGPSPEDNEPDIDFQAADKVMSWCQAHFFCYVAQRLWSRLSYRRKNGVVIGFAPKGMKKGRDRAAP